MATTCQTYPVNPGDTDLADVADPHAASASGISKADAPTSARNQSRCRQGHSTPCRRSHPFITIRRCGPSPGSTAAPTLVIRTGVRCRGVELVCEEPLVRLELCVAVNRTGTLRGA